MAIEPEASHSPWPFANLPDCASHLNPPLEIRPAECLVIEDSLNGVKSAKAAGMSVWVVPNRVTEGLDFSAADRIFPSLIELAEALQ